MKCEIVSRNGSRIFQEESLTTSLFAGFEPALESELVSNEELVRKMPCSILLVKKEPAIFGEVD